MLARQEQLSSSARERTLRSSTEPPPVSDWLVQWFGWYGERLLRRNFHSVRVAANGGPPEAQGPLIIFLNHASWWDPMVALLLQRRCFGGRRAYAPMDSDALQKYPFFRRMGFFGVEQGTVRGGVQFMRKAESVMQGQNVLWLTPQGRFADVRERPVRFQPGIGHLATRFSAAQFVPLALEYSYWEERFPEVLVRFGKALPGFHFVNPSHALRALEAELAETQDKLETSVKSRRKDEFHMLLSGAKGVGGFYDLWRRLRAGLRRETFNPSHGNL